ncbi:MAG TPA: hypothetical protein VNL92_02920, partial [Dehalococcoidia bacterium]|nr:hypothetical protein [Dehalococcoidia bacterium]
VFEGGYWTPDFAKGLGSVAFRDEPEGGQSFVPQPDRVSHWWNGTSPRPSVPPDAVAVHVRVQVRLIPNSDPLADLSAARYVANQSADSYRSPSGGWLGDIAMPRLKLITPQWQWFTMTTLYEAELRANPPPPLLPPASMPDDGDGQSPPTGVPGLTVTPASPYRAGLNSITVVGGGAPSAIADVVATESRRAVIALWLLQDNAWLYFLPQAPERSTLHSVSPAAAALFVELA